jgi:PIN domain nuclease of toxin-antitoxin system
MTKGYLLDTQVLYWLGESPSRLGQRTRKALQSANLYFSTISVAELSFKRRFGGLEYSIHAPDVWQEIGISQLTFGLEAANAFSRFSPEWVPDPLDRQIMATAAASNLTLVTSDRRILSHQFDWVLDATT